MDGWQTPRIVFFTGGTALRELSRVLAAQSSNVAHLVTTFDAGGSTAALRKAFAMPAVGDIRNRLLALADTDIVPSSVLDFMNHRLPTNGNAEALRAELAELAAGRHRLWQNIPTPFADPLRELVNDCVSRLPANFDPFGASIGNIALCGGYLRHKRDFAPVLAFLGQLLRVRGHVVPIVDESLHLACELDDGRFVVGQQHFKALPGAVRRLMLTVHDPQHVTGSLSDATPCRPPLSEKARHYIATANLICYPMGSFYSSVLANLLPRGVAGAIAANPCPKIFIPNSGADPEIHGLSLPGQVELLLDTLRADAPGKESRHFLDAILVDTKNGRYHGTDRLEQTLRAHNVKLCDSNIVSSENAACHNPEATLKALLTACDFCR